MKADQFTWWNLWYNPHKDRTFGDGIILREVFLKEDGYNMEPMFTLLKYHVASSRYVGKPLIDEDGNLVTSFKHTIILSSDEIDALIVAKLLKQ